MPTSSEYVDQWTKDVSPDYAASRLLGRENGRADAFSGFRNARSGLFRLCSKYSCAAIIDDINLGTSLLQASRFRRAQRLLTHARIRDAFPKRRHHDDLSSFDDLVMNVVPVGRQERAPLGEMRKALVIRTPDGFATTADAAQRTNL